MRYLKKVVLILVWIYPSLLFSQYEWDVLWHRVYGNPPGIDMRLGPDGYIEFCERDGMCADNEVAIDGEGNIVTIASRGGGLENELSTILVQKLNPDDGSVIWDTVLQQFWDQAAADVKVDRTGNYVVLYRVDVGNHNHCWGGKLYRLDRNTGNVICQNYGYFWSGDSENCWHNYWDGPYGMDIDGSNDIVIVSYDVSNFYMWKFSSSCSLLWNMVIHDSPYPYHVAGRDVVVDRNGDYVAVGYDGQTASMMVVKVSPSGSIIWKKFYSISRAGGRPLTADAEIAVDSSNNYVIATYDGKVIRMDSDGNVIWSNSYANVRFDGIQVPASEPTYLLVGTYYETGSVDKDIYVAKIRQSDGAVLWIRMLDMIANPTDSSGGDLGSGIAISPVDQSIVVSGYAGNANYGGYERVIKLAGLTPVSEVETPYRAGDGMYRVYTPGGRLIFTGRPEQVERHLRRPGLYILRGEGEVRVILRR